ncbi:MAG: ribonuclease III [Bacteroides sp.]
MHVLYSRNTLNRIVRYTIINKIRFFFCKDKESYLRFYKILGFYPRNISLYEQALLHKSSSIKSEQGDLLNNERLEFLGDAILDAVVADIVYKRFEGKKEGFLTNTRSKIVQRETLNKLALEIGLDKLIKSSTHSFSHNSYMCGNAFEALVGAIYLDQGYEVCKRFMEDNIIKRFINVETIAHKEVNFKSKLIEWSQKNRVSISFELIKQSLEKGSDPVFQTEVLIEGLCGGTGTGYSKKESQQMAAKIALKRIRTEQDFMSTVLTAKETNEALANEMTNDEIIIEKVTPNELIIEETIINEPIIDEFIAETK